MGGNIVTDYSDQPELKGVGGWLLTFIVILSVISPIRILLETAKMLELDAQTEAQLGSSWQIYSLFSWVLAAATLALAWFLAYRLARVHTRASVRLVVRGLWVLAFGPLLLDLIVAWTLWPDVMATGLDATYFVGIFQAAVFATIWSLYLTKSKRVENTFVDDETEARKIFG